LLKNSERKKNISRIFTGIFKNYILIEYIKSEKERLRTHKKINCVEFKHFFIIDFFVWLVWFLT